MKRRKLRRRESERYRIIDFLADVTFFIPELLFLPIRLLIWMIRPLARLISDIF
ncbi:hypothetical protein [Sporosarcina cyprini]|uniref:hypothetical protein n=1 Tax=Sporosarcina cyprini TaxID=2910523 RepID=UPI001EDE7C5E|nr:hypothetical protein [Sporosarcina cyprini]MCG3087502.1 hypothetical protein [Sporosarcina cyprini]